MKCKLNYFVMPDPQTEFIGDVYKSRIGFQTNIALLGDISYIMVAEHFIMRQTRISYRYSVTNLRTKSDYWYELKNSDRILN